MVARKKTVTELERERLTKDRRRRHVKIKITSYRVPTGTAASKMVDFFIWAVETHPGEWITYEEITQAVNGLTRRPTPSDKSVRLTANRISSARENMYKHHAKDIITLRGVGARATVDEKDKAEHSLQRDAIKLMRANGKLSNTMAIIDRKLLEKEFRQAKKCLPAELVQEYVDLMEYHDEIASKILKTIEKPATRKALAPPVMSAPE